MSGGAGYLAHPLLVACGVAHGFGLRGARRPPGLVRPRQVHGSRVARVGTAGRAGLEDADAVVSDAPHVPVGVVTADCVPILLATPSGSCVAAVHAGWRGLARGVVGCAVAALRRADTEGGRAVAVIGPHVGPCCYEVDAPVREALGERLGACVERVFAAGRPGHWQLDLAAAVRVELERAGLAPERTAQLDDACTACDAARFHSRRRDGEEAGRLVHFVAARVRDEA